MVERGNLGVSRTVMASAALVLLLGACGGVETDFAAIDSPGGEFRLAVTVTVPALPHARHTVSAYLERAGSGEREMLIETKLANDGVPFTDRNIGIRWTGKTTALICLRPTDLADRGIRIDVNGTPQAVIKPGC